MAQPQGEEHILKGVTEHQYLPPLQKQILLYLAESHPQSRYSTKRGIKGHYKSVYDAIDDLLKKKIIVEIKKEEYRNRDHSVYWLTPAGVLIALVKGANAKTVLNRTMDVYPNNTTLQCEIELTTILGTEAHQIGYQAILKKGKLEESDASQVMGTLITNIVSLEQIMAIINIMKKYPEQYRNFKEQIYDTMEKFKETGLFLKDALENS